jgi:flagellar hook-associated protein 3 FlgL
MQLRVTLQTRALQIRESVQDRAADVERTSEEITSGRKLLRPSDDPVGARQSLMNRARLAQIEQFKSNIDLSLGDLNAADSFLDQVNLRLTRAKEIAIQMGSDANSPAARDAAALEVDALIDDLVALGNSTFRGRAIFAGENTLSSPYTRTGNSVTYSGTETGLQRRISNDMPLVETTVPGTLVFGSGATNAFQTLFTLKAALEANDGNGIRNTLPSINADQERVLSARTIIGGRTERVQKTRDRLEAQALEIQSLQATIEDADLAESISALQLRQTALQATLGVAGQVLPTTLMDFLRR